MSRFNWDDLTDSALSSRLQGLQRDVHCETLLLYHHTLTHVPDLTQYRQFDNLQVLSVSDNLSSSGISVIQPCHIPRCVTRLDLSRNKLSEVSDFSGHSKLSYLNLCHNNISVIQPSHIPRSVTHLNLSWNKLSEVGDFSGHSTLSDLNLCDNNIGVIQPSHIPHSVTRLNLSGNQLSEVSDFSGHSTLSDFNLCLNNISVIQPCHIPRNVTLLDLSGNESSEVGDFSGHSTLSDFNLCLNNISVIQPCHIPRNVTLLDLSGNQLSEVGDFSGHSTLSDLNLCDNNIGVIQPCHIPCSVTHLDLFNNKLSEVGDFSQHTHLSAMDMRLNRIHTIYGLPNNLLKLQAEKGIRVLGKKCFHEKTYEILKKMTKDCGWVLQKPPVDVLNQGLKAVIDYFDEKLVRSGQTRLVLLGPTTAGKTSLMESLIRQRPVLVQVLDRTRVANVKPWDISAEDTILIFDQGGHEIYTITSPLFQGPNSIVLLVHDVTKVGNLELDNTAATLCQALQYHPDNQVYTVLTHTDLLDPVTAEANVGLIKKRLEITIDEEVHNIKMSDTTEEVEKQSILLNKQKENMKYFLISCKTYKGLNDLEDFLRHIVAEKRVIIPKRWVQLYKIMMQQSKTFWNVKDLEKIFRNLHSRLQRLSQIFKIPKQFTSALRYYRDAGHLLFFETVPNLNEFAFHNIQFIIDLLKSCFSHDLRHVIDYKNDQSLQALFTETHIELILQQYQREGLLCKELLHFLWQKHNLEVREMDAFLELLKLFHLCYPIDKDSQLLFFPWFVQHNTSPNGINPNKLTTLDATHFSVELDCQFASRIPVNVFEMMLVQLQKTALEKKYGVERFAWRDGLLVQIGSLQCIAIRKREDSTVSICVRGYTSDLQPIWQVTSDVYTDMKSTLVPFRGVIKRICFNCNHCRAKGITSVKKWLPDDVLPSKPLVVSYQRCHEEDIPSALVIAISANVTNVEKHIKRVEDYLGSVQKALSLPDKLLYLDCEEVSEGDFQLSWCWPRCKDEGDVFSEAVDKTITHAVVQYRQGDGWKQVTEDVKQSPYTITCFAEEFRVVAANKNGAGEFICVTPCHIVNADEVISESDYSQIKANHEFFTRMSNVWEIVLRLFSRDVIDSHAKESVVRKLTIEKNQHQAADLLMESIYRLRYQQLFLFQKTLRETGQMVMADSLPVRLEHESGELVRAESLPLRLEHEPGQMVRAESLPVWLEHEPGQMVRAESLPVRAEHEPGQMVMAESLPVRLKQEILPLERVNDDGLDESSVEVAVLPQEEWHERESTMLDLEEDFHTDNRILTYYRN